MQKSEAAALIRVLRVTNKSLEHMEKIIGKVLSGSVKEGDKRPKRSTDLKPNRPRRNRKKVRIVS